ncbi:protein ZINC INDUCED FACILITATOR-LIKE 1 isoform X1 [Populus alba x Populus x berolinensis]|nr:protein ZINC INDUCED FACILITATOR-LIKE 1 isoform X1 [Populus alba x Populus x berolinensis]
MDGNGIGESFLKKKKYYEDCPGSLKNSTNHMLFLRNWNFPLISGASYWNKWSICAGQSHFLTLDCNEIAYVLSIGHANHAAFWHFAVWNMIMKELRIIMDLSIYSSFMFFTLNSMIRDFHIAKREEDIGYYAGYVGSAFMFGRALTSVLWGMIADRYGRKPVIIFGTVSVVIFNTLFGLSTSFWMAISTRFLLGSLCGILGPMRAYASEVCRKEYQALGMSIISTSWGIGLVIGPALGGFLAQPAEKFPKIFSSDSLFGRFPYLLPCLLISIFSVGALVVCCLLPETIHNHKGNDEECNDSDALGATTFESNSSQKSLLKNWPLISSIIAYCVFQLHDMAYAEIFSLWAVSPRKNGGLSFSTADVGEVLAFSGFGLLLFQLFIYPVAERNFGPVVVSRLGAVSITTGLFLLQNRSVAQQQRGAANGISMSAMSLFKAIGPAAGGSLFSWAQKRQSAFFLPGDQMVFFLLNMIEVIGLFLTFKPFLALPDDNIS